MSENSPFFNMDPTLSKSSLGDRDKKVWVEDCFFCAEQTGRQTPLPGSRMHIGTSFLKRDALFFYTIVLLTLGIILGKVIYLQAIKGKEYKNFSETNRQRIIPIPSERGLIFDKNQAELTKNIPSFSLALIPQDLPRNKEKREEIVKTLAELTHQEKSKIRETIEEYGNYSYESIVIQEDLDYETALLIQIAAGDLPGLHIQRGSKRLYRLDGTASTTISSLSHIIGYQGKLNREELDRLYKTGYLPSDNIGKTALEKQYETSLRGKYGRRRIEVDALGKQQKILGEEAPVPGKYLTLSIDSKIQETLESIVSSTIKKAKKAKAAAVVMNPQNGEVLALVSLPSFDNNDFSGGIDLATYKTYIENKNNPLFNRTIAGTYPSGSVIKPAIASAALQEGIIKANTTFNSVGGIAVGVWFFPDWLAGGHGLTNVRKSIANSVNTFYYYIGGGHKDFLGLGVDRITKYLKKYGLSSKLGIDLPGEQPGFLPSKQWKEEVKEERWYIGDTYNLSIGQGDLLITPLQVAAMTGTIANGGTLYQPHVVSKITDPVTKEVQKIEPKIIKNNIVNRAHINTVRLGMRDCVIYGSCRLLSSLPFAAAGKTGTAQWSSTKENHAWFTSFAPFNNPEIVVTILVEEGEEGSRISAPIAFEFYKWWWNYRNS